MAYLLDTCVVLEFTKPTPDPAVVAWLRNTPESSLHLSAVTLGELQQGISRLPPSARRQKLQSWLDDDLRARFASRVLVANADVCLLWGRIRAGAAEAGATLPVLDAMIAAMALHRHFTLVTRNERDFARVPSIRLLNPWLV